MSPRDYLVALACVVMWGLTFPVIKALSEFVPGVFLNACRFFIIAIPAILIKPPSIGKRSFIAFSLLFGCGQYLLSTLAIYYGLSAGITAVIMQIQVFVTIALSQLILKEKSSHLQVFGVVLGFIGVTSFLLFNTYFSISTVGLALAIMASLSWGAVNMVVKTSSVTDFTSLVAWGAIPNVPILFGISYFMGDFDKISMTLSQSIYFAAALIFLGIVVTFLVSVQWNGLLKKYSAIYVAPLSLLIPVVGLVSSWIFFSDEQAKQLAPVALVFIGLLVVFYANYQASRSPSRVS